jgi:hypothetical protein
MVTTIRLVGVYINRRPDKMDGHVNGVDHLPAVQNPVRIHHHRLAARRIEHDHRYFRSLKDHPQIQIRQIVVVAKHYSVYRGVLATKAFRYIALSPDSAVSLLSYCYT